MFKYPTPIAPGRYRLDEVMLAAHGPARAAELLRRFGSGDIAYHAFTQPFRESLIASAERYEALAAEE